MSEENIICGTCPACGTKSYTVPTKEELEAGFAKFVCPVPECGEEFKEDIPEQPDLQK